MDNSTERKSTTTTPSRTSQKVQVEDLPSVWMALALRISARELEKGVLMLVSFVLSTGTNEEMIARSDSLKSSDADSVIRIDLDS